MPISIPATSLLSRSESEGAPTVLAVLQRFIRFGSPPGRQAICPWCENPSHPSLNFKEVGEDLWSARVDSNYRALARWRNGFYTWFWIGTHSDYEMILTGKRRG